MELNSRTNYELKYLKPFYIGTFNKDKIIEIKDITCYFDVYTTYHTAVNNNAKILYNGQVYTPILFFNFLKGVQSLLNIFINVPVLTLKKNNVVIKISDQCETCKNVIVYPKGYTHIKPFYKPVIKSNNLKCLKDMPLDIIIITTGIVSFESSKISIINVLSISVDLENIKSTFKDVEILVTNSNDGIDLYNYKVKEGYRVAIFVYVTDMY